MLHILAKYNTAVVVSKIRDFLAEKNKIVKKLKTLFLSPLDKNNSNYYSLVTVLFALLIWNFKCFKITCFNISKPNSNNRTNSIFQTNKSNKSKEIEQIRLLSILDE